MRTLPGLLAIIALAASGCVTHNRNPSMRPPKPSLTVKPVKAAKPEVNVAENRLTMISAVLGCRCRFANAKIAPSTSWELTDCSNPKRWQLTHRSSGAQAVLTFRWSRRSPAKLISRYLRSVKRHQGQVIVQTGQTRGSRKSRIVFFVPTEQDEDLIGTVWARRLDNDRHRHVEVVAVWSSAQDPQVFRDFEELLASIR